MMHSHSIDNLLLAVGISLGLTFTTMGARAQPCVPGGNAEEGALDARIPSFLNAWKVKYPTSTLPARMAAMTGRECNVCHHPPNFDTPGNCYRADIAGLIGLGMSIEQALDQLDAADSDGDGVSNGQEALAPRPEPGEVGYSPGLIGDTGTDPCGTIPNESVTGMPETPSAAVPAISALGMLAMVLLIITSASLVIRKRTCRS